MKPHPAANLVTFLMVEPKEPITTKSIEGLLLVSSMEPRWVTRAGHADALVRKAPEAIRRADEDGRNWLAASTAGIVAGAQAIAIGDRRAFEVALNLLRGAGWSETLVRIAGHFDTPLRSSFPPAKGSLSRAAARLLREMQQRAQ
jgi:hypothetical protein